MAIITFPKIFRNVIRNPSTFDFETAVVVRDARIISFKLSNKTFSGR